MYTAVAIMATCLDIERSLLLLFQLCPASPKLSLGARESSLACPELGTATFFDIGGHLRDTRKRTTGRNLETATLIGA